MSGGRHQRWAIGWLASSIVLVGAVLAVRAAQPDLDATWWLVLRRATEAWVVIGLFAIALRDLPLRRVATRVGPARSLLLGMLVLGYFVAQFLLSSSFHPFHTWSMYTRSADSITYTVLTGRSDHDDEPVKLAVVDLIPALDPRPFTTTLDRLVDAHERGNVEATQLLEELAVLLGTRHQGEPLTAVAITSCRVEDPTRSDPASCRLVHTVSITQADR